MGDRSERILDTAMDLAEQGGFEAVRLRDVASGAGVALGTVYKRFRSKEDILVAALEREAEVLQKALEMNPITGDTAFVRVTAFFELVTRGLLLRPNLARAALRAVSSGEPEIAEKVVRFNGAFIGNVTAALRGVGDDGSPGTEEELLIASLLQKLWFASMVGWMGGLFGEEQVMVELRAAARLMLAGAGLR